MENNNLQIAGRFKEIRKVHLLMSQQELGLALGLHGNSISDIEKGKSAISTTMLYNINAKFDINPSWLVTGKGPVFTADIDDFLLKPGDSEGNQPAYIQPDLKFYDGEDSLSKDIFKDKEGDLASSVFKLNIFRDCDIALTFHGNAMAPLCNTGDIVICMEVSGWDNWVDYGQLFLIVTRDNQRLIRYIRKSTTDGFFKLAGINPQFDDIELPISEIEFLYLVRGKIERIR